jgi:adenosylhomocysteine nucleosidase/futalosine hydrolase
MAACAATVAHTLSRHHPDCIILAGIAGTYRTSDLQIGDVVSVGEERVAGLPAQFAMCYHPTIRPFETRSVISNTVSQSNCAPEGADIENMEGASFYAIASALGIPAIEVRAISNWVGQPYSAWRVDDACQNLANKLSSVISHLTEDVLIANN